MIRSDRMAPEPDYEAVMAEEFRAATNAGTSAALIRFIARHPEHRLAEEARALLAERTLPDPAPAVRDPDGDVIAAFDAARRQGSAEAYRAFVSRYANHPLAAEARRQESRVRQAD